MRRPYVLLTIGVVVLLFLAISALLARVFSADGAERTAITSLLEAQARGSAGAIAAQIRTARTTPRVAPARRSTPRRWDARDPSRS